jgi:hypothetical protein
MSRWETLQEWIAARGSEPFTAHELADDRDIPHSWVLSFKRIWEPNGDQDSPRAMCSRAGSGLVPLAGRWGIGRRMCEPQGTLRDDLTVTISRAFVPDMHRFASLNPKQAAAIDRTISALVDGALVMLTAALDGLSRPPSTGQCPRIRGHCPQPPPGLHARLRLAARGLECIAAVRGGMPHGSIPSCTPSRITSTHRSPSHSGHRLGLPLRARDHCTGGRRSRRRSHPALHARGLAEPLCGIDRCSIAHPCGWV